MNKQKLWKWGLIVLLIVLGAALVSIAVIGYYDRPVYDDYIYLKGYADRPLRVFDFNVNGRYTALVIFGLTYNLPHLLQFVPLASVIIMLTTFYFSLKMLLAKRLEQYPRLIAAVIAAGLSLAVFLMLPGPYSSLYWYSAAVSRSWPMFFVMVYGVYLLSRSSRGKAHHWYVAWPVFFLLPIVVGAMDETGSAILIGVSVIALLLARSKKNRVYIRYGLYSLAGSLISLAILYFGSARRRALITRIDHASMLDRTLELPHKLGHFLLKSAPHHIHNHSVILLLFAVGLVVSVLVLKKTPVSAKRLWQWLGWSTLIAIIFASLDYSVTWIAAGKSSFDRGYILPVMTVVVFAVVLGLIAGQLLLKYKITYTRWITAGVVVIAGVFLILHLAYIPYTYRFAHKIKQRGIDWDQRNALILKDKQAGQCMIAVPNLAINQYMHDLWPDPAFWVNNSPTHYYGLKKPCRVYAEK